MKKTKINDFDTVPAERYQRNLSIPYIKEPVSRLVKDVFADYRKKEINLQPEFQRQFVWSKKKQKELIKSLFAGFPLPMFYFAETEDSMNEVVDGQQRLTTIFGFIKPESIDKSIRRKLISNIRINHNGANIDINSIRKAIKKQKIYCVYLPPESSMKLKYEIFQMLNQGATILRAQEIRNCIFASEMPEFNKLLKAVANKLRNITGMTLDRMLGEELALRFFVINKYGYERDVTNLLNNFNNLKRDFDKQELRIFRKKSKYFFTILKKIFGDDIDNCFQVLQKGTTLPKINKWKLYSFSNKINQSLFHLLSFYLPKFSTNQLNSKNFSKIKKGYLELLKNKRFVSVITGAGTNSKKNIIRSKQIFEKAFLKKYVGDWTIKSKRSISPSEKKTIRKNIPYCYLCYGKFRKNIETSQIHAEHIEDYSSGKETKFSNILLAHAKCNSEKKGMPIEVYRSKPKSIKRRKKNKKNIPEYRKAIREWNKAYPLDIYYRLMRFAKSDLQL